MYWNLVYAGSYKCLGATVASSKSTGCTSIQYSLIAESNFKNTANVDSRVFLSALKFFVIIFVESIKIENTVINYVFDTFVLPRGSGSTLLIDWDTVFVSYSSNTSIQLLCWLCLFFSQNIERAYQSFRLRDQRFTATVADCGGSTVSNPWHGLCCCVKSFFLRF